MQLGGLTGSRDNNFDVLRLIAAGLVLGSHSFPLAGYREPLHRHTLGTLGVEIFFAISGFLVTRSWAGDPHVGRFLLKRALRLLPGLAVAVVFTGLVVGSIYTTRPLDSYLGSRSLWGYVGQNVVLIPDYVIRSVFMTNPNQSPNGSLWTLPVEARAYVALALVGAVGLLRRRLVLAAAGAVAVLNVVTVVSPSLQLVSFFVGGSALYLSRDRVVLRPAIAIAAAIAWLASYDTRLSTAVGLLVLPYLVVYFAYRTPPGLRRLTAAGDVSYGLYLYAFPIQQAVIATLGVINPVLLFAIAAPLTWTAAFASWRIVEEPMLRLKLRAPEPGPPQERFSPATP